MINLIKFVTNAFVYFILLNFGSCLDDLQSSVHLKWNHYDNRTPNITRLKFQCENEQEIEDNFFQCDNGACIYKIHECDGIEQCTDGSDEWAQTCEKYSFENRQKRTTSTSGDCAAPSSSPDRTIVYECDTEGNSGSCITNGLIRETTIAKVVCNAKYLAGDEYGYESSCNRKKWYPNLRKCYKICNKLTPKNLDLECYRNNVRIDCKENTLRAGDKVKISCRPQHTFQSNVPPNYNQITCREDGSWDKDLFTCIPTCGRSFTEATTLISNGVLEHFGDSPWHVAIYNQKKILICGGTIIHPLLVLSAAHCFYYEDGKMQNSKNFKVVVSKVSRNYTIKDNAYQKTYKIKEIRFSEFKGYYSLTNYHSADIAILVLKEEITIGPTVLPACIDTTRKKYYPPEGTLAKVVGWGMNEKGEYSELLHTANLPYIGRKRCLETVNEDFKPYITLDKFCAGSEEKEGAGVLQGDSGGGILFQEFGFYFIRGIVSIKQPVDNSKIAAFTDLADHMDWILSVRDQIDQESNNTDRKMQYFDVDLLRALMAKEGGNIVVSPFAVKLALSMLYLGTHGTAGAAKEIEDALNINSTLKETVEQKYPSLLRSLKLENGYEFSIGMKLFVDLDTRMELVFLKKLRDYFNSSAHPLDFKNEQPTVNLINDWYNNVIKGKLSRIVNESDFNDDTIMMLLSAINFRGEWKYPFSSSNENRQIFYVSESKRIHVTMMSLTEKLVYYDMADIGFRLIRIPYYPGNTFAMYILSSPFAEDLEKSLKVITPDILKKLYPTRKEQMINLNLPKFKFESTSQLVEVLKMLNIKELFSEKALESMGSNPKGSLVISSILQKCIIEVNEKGTGDSSNINNVLIDSRFGAEPLDVTVNYPFVFFIADEVHNNVLFIGKVIEPRY